MQPIAYLSRILNDAEKQYWPTEMEVLGFVWTLAKWRHWIDGTHAPPATLFTDHNAIVDLPRNSTSIANSTAGSVGNKKLLRGNGVRKPV